MTALRLESDGNPRREREAIKYGASELTDMDLQLAAISDVPDIVGTIVQDPLSIVLLLVGALFVGVSLGFFGLLTLGAVVEFLTPDSVAARHP